MITYTKYFKETWLPVYIKQYKESNYNERKAIRENVYKNIHLKEKEKNSIWETIVRSEVKII
jgi:hypothetical protein